MARAAVRAVEVMVEAMVMVTARAAAVWRIPNKSKIHFGYT